jgi:hypothetical protein
LSLSVGLGSIAIVWHVVLAGSRSTVERSHRPTAQPSRQKGRDSSSVLPECQRIEAASGRCLKAVPRPSGSGRVDLESDRSLTVAVRLAEQLSEPGASRYVDFVPPPGSGGSTVDRRSVSAGSTDAQSIRFTAVRLDGG